MNFFKTSKGRKLRHSIPPLIAHIFTNKWLVLRGKLNTKKLPSHAMQTSTINNLVWNLFGLVPTIKLLILEFWLLVKKVRSYDFWGCDYSYFRSYASPPVQSSLASVWVVQCSMPQSSMPQSSISQSSVPQCSGHLTHWLDSTNNTACTHTCTMGGDGGIPLGWLFP